MRPGHADLAGMQKYGFTDARDVLERASARETAARVAAGALAKKLLSYLGIEVISHVIQMGVGQGRRPAACGRRRPTSTTVDASEVRCFDAAASEAMVEAIKAAAKEGDSLGGVVEVLGFGVPVGLGSHVHWDRKLDALLAQALMSIQAVKGVEIGDGFEVAGRLGSEAHDAIRWNPESESYTRLSTLAGGVEGGMTNGELLVARAAMKPLATLNRPTLETVDTATKESAVSFKERTDVTAVPAMGVVAETMVALVLAAGGAAQVRRRLGRRVRAQRRVVPPDAVSPRRPIGSDGSARGAWSGLMGVGKTTVGRGAGATAGTSARRLRLPHRGAHRAHGQADPRRRRRRRDAPPRGSGVVRRARRRRAARDRRRGRGRARRRQPPTGSPPPTPTSCG